MAKAGKNAERIAAEQAEQARWRLRESKPKYKIFDDLVVREFLPPEHQAAVAARSLANIVAYAASNVPYYRDLFARLKLSPRDVARPDQLPLLPELDKKIIQSEERRLMTEKLPPKQRYAGSHTSSGSTGVPTRVHETAFVIFLRDVITQRQRRWCRYDPSLTLAALRGERNLPHHPDGRLVKPGEPISTDAWPGTGRYFVTGPFHGLSMYSTFDQKIDWLERCRPNYLFAMSTDIEHLAFAFQGRPNLPGLRGIQAASEPLTQGMQDRIERTFGARVNISYGLDEVGWIAGRCLEGGRYHVHVEHCWVEIVDEQSKPCRPGEYGRLLVTVTSNAMMPLLRYVTDDIVLALDDSPCPCGRTLPAFGEIVGRYSILNRLPPGTMAVVDALRGAMERLPPELSGSQREYQIRQTLDGNFGLRLVLAGPRPEGFDDYIARAFREGLARRGVSGGADPVLTIAEVAAIPRAASAKFFRFVSEFTRPELAKDRVEDPLAVQVTGTPA